jgi:hypothetical protein
VSKGRDKGTSAERMVVEYLKARFWPHAERRALAGSLDKGDITGTVGLAWEVKAAARLEVPAWLRETETERVNAKADHAVLVIKPTGLGKGSVGRFYALMDAAQFETGLRVHAPNPYFFETTYRKMKFDPALIVAEANAVRLDHLSYWVKYPDFVMTSLGQMTKLLFLAGYGSNGHQ